MNNAPRHPWQTSKYCVPGFNFGTMPNHLPNSLTTRTQLPSPNLAAEDRRAGVLVRCRDRVVDVDEDTRVRGLVRARESNLVRGVGAAAACDADLGARNVELGTP